MLSRECEVECFDGDIFGRGECDVIVSFCEMGCCGDVGQYYFHGMTLFLVCVLLGCIFRIVFFIFYLKFTACVAVLGVCCNMWG